MSRSTTKANSQDLNGQLSTLNSRLKKQNSLSQAFLRGVMTGLGATVGLTIVVTLVAFIINYIANLFGQQSVGQSIIEVLQ